jgi:transcriptional regulator with XRE-family HTH domain
VTGTVIEQSLGSRLRVLRSGCDLTQSALAKKSGVKRGSICLYEKDKAVPDAATLEKLLRAMGLTWASLDRAYEFLDGLAACSIDAPHERGTSLDMSISEAAPRLFAMLGNRTPVEQRAMIREEPRMRQVSLATFLCLESEQRGLNDPSKAVSIAELAVFLVGELAVEERERAELFSFAWAHVGNAQRVLGELAKAETAFAEGARHWDPLQEGRGMLVDAARILALKGSLRIAQRRLPEASDLLFRALGICDDLRLKARILVSRARISEEECAWDDGIAQLYDAAPFVDPSADPRLYLCIQHNLIWLLTNAGRNREAKLHLPEVVKLSRHLGGVLDRIRLQWVEARIAAEDAEVDRAISLFSKVRGEFASRSMGYDTALVSLELGSLYAKLGRTAEVKTLARHMVPVFKAQDVHREALAALTLFRNAAEGERATEALVEQILTYLRKARHNPSLRFEAQAAA